MVHAIGLLWCEIAIWKHCAALERAMKQTQSQLNELLEIARDGKDFYQQAGNEVSDMQLKMLFRDMAQAKTEVIVALLSKAAANHGEPIVDSSSFTQLHRFYAEAHASLGNDAGYVSGLGRAESEFLYALEDAMQDAEPDVRALLIPEIPKMRACHTRLRLLEHRA
jgi:uncharacterized protein (TIGR02284 family)